MYELGQVLKVTYVPAHLSKTTVTRIGEVIYSNEYYFTVKFKKFKESFRYTDRSVKVEVQNGNKRTA